MNQRAHVSRPSRAASIIVLCAAVAVGCENSGEDNPVVTESSPTSETGDRPSGTEPGGGSSATTGTASQPTAPQSTSDSTDAPDTTGETGTGDTAPTTTGSDPSDPFSFIVFGDLNGGGCDKNDRFHRLVPMMLAAEPEFILHTGDIIEGFGQDSCFGAQPPGTACNDDNESGNMAQQMAPLFDAPHDPELRASFFPVIGNHDGNWGSGWYPDPCGGGICSLFGMDSAGIAQTYVDHGATLDVEGFEPHMLEHGDICGLDEGGSGHPEDFYYGFGYRNSYFIILRLHEDFSGMLDCNGGTPGYDSCAEYCSAPELRLDPARNNACYSVHQYDWLTTQLMTASENYDHIFVFAHAPLLGSGENHSPNSDAPVYRALFDQYEVNAYFNGHNHAYERTVPVRDGVENVDGTHYVTVGTGGALTDTISGDQFTAFSYEQWTGYGDYEQMTSYVQVRVDGGSVNASVVTLAGDTVDEFQID